MMTSGLRCPSPELRESLVAYAYHECEPAERGAIEEHLRECLACEHELAELRRCREALAAWTVPEPTSSLRIVDAEATPPRGARRWSWGLATAAAIVLAVGLWQGVEVRSDADGWVIRLGLPRASETAPVAAVSNGSSESEAVVGRRGGTVRDAARAPRPLDEAPWRGDLVAPGEELRREVAAADRQVPASGPPAGATVTTPRDLTREIERLIAQSEARRQQELAGWIDEFAQEIDLQRRADQQWMDQQLRALEGYADYLVRTSGR